MKDIEEFVEFSIKIEKHGNGEFGYFPFHCFVEKQDGTYDIIVIAGVNTVEDCYKLMAMYVAKKCKRLYMALDFPAGGDMGTDFVAVFATEDVDFKAFAIPYNTKTGETYKKIIFSQRMKHIVSNLRDVVFSFGFKINNNQN